MGAPTPKAYADGGLPLLVKAGLQSVPGLNRVPGVRKAPAADFSGLAISRPGVPVERAAVDAYARVCGFPRKDTVPVTFPHLLAFPLHLAILTDRDFPAQAMGLVHVENSIVSHRPVRIGETLDVTVRTGPARPHAKGRVFELTATVRADDELVWESVSAYLRRGGGDPQAPTGADLPEAPPTGAVWRLPADLGRRYAAVSGDRNPIHLYPLPAKALGFPRQIAHGMWSKARCVAALENRLPDAVRIDVAFRKPILLPGSVAFGSRRLADGWAFSLRSPRSGAPHLLGRATSA